MVLAAGAGRRMPSSPKLLLPFRGKPILTWVLELVERLPVAERVLILGAYADRIRAALFLEGQGRARRRGGQEWQVVLNPGWEEGMGSSLRLAAGIGQGGLLLFLGDMPRVPEEVARAVILRAGEKPLGPSYQGQRGFPLFFPASLRPILQRARGDEGARGMIPSWELIPVDDPGVIADVDTPADLMEGTDVV